MRVEVLKGLPGVGPPALHFHSGSPTPWSEGYVVRCKSANGHSWIGNFQNGASWYSCAEPWPHADRVIVIAHGVCYLVTAADPKNYVIKQIAATGLLFDESHERLFVGDYFDLFAYGRSGEVLWERKHFGTDGIELLGCEQGVLRGRRCVDPPDYWRDFRVSVLDGNDA